MSSLSYFINTKLNIINSIIFQIPKRTSALPRIIFTYNDTMEFTYVQTNKITPLAYGLLFLMNYQFVRDSYYNKIEYLRIMSIFGIRFESTRKILTAVNIMHTIISENANDNTNHVTYDIVSIQHNINLNVIYPIPYTIEYITTV